MTTLIKEHKHIGMILDLMSSFQSHIGEDILKARIGIGIIRSFSKMRYIKGVTRNCTPPLQLLSSCRWFNCVDYQQLTFEFETRLMTMSPLYSCGKTCSRGTHHETVKNLALFSSIINGIRKESRLRISIPWECF